MRSLEAEPFVDVTWWKGAHQETCGDGRLHDFNGSLWLRKVGVLFGEIPDFPFLAFPQWLPHSLRFLMSLHMQLQIVLPMEFPSTFITWILLNDVQVTFIFMEPEKREIVLITKL